jgi:hypothetical protein
MGFNVLVDFRYNPISKFLHLFSFTTPIIIVFLTMLKIQHKYIKQL